MKKIIALVLGAAAIGSAVAQPSVGVSIGINQPGVYGRINIGDIPRPALVGWRHIQVDRLALNHHARLDNDHRLWQHQRGARNVADVDEIGRASCRERV